MPDSPQPPDLVTALRAHAPHLYALETDEGLRAQLRQLEDQEALVHAKDDLATAAGIDSAEHPSDFEKFTHALRVARESSAATIDLETLRIAYITEALAVTQATRRPATAEV